MPNGTAQSIGECIPTALVNAVGMRNLTHPFAWTPDDEAVFIYIKQDSSRATALADYAKPFYLDVSERATNAQSSFRNKGAIGKF